MSKSLIQTANTSSQAVAVNGTISLGTVIRRFGCNCRLSGNAIEIDGAGYYTVEATITVAPTAAGNTTIALYRDNVPVAGAVSTGSITTVGNSLTVPISTTIRQGCNCDGASQLTFVLTAGAGDVTNISARVEKV